nr:hypothetical protein [Pseudoalteromonas sp. WY3]
MNELLFSFSVAQALCIVIMQEYKLFNPLKRTLVLSTILFSIVINARIGLVVLLCYLLVITFPILIRSSIRVKVILFASIAFIFCAPFIFSLDSYKSPIDGVIGYQIASFYGVFFDLFGIGAVLLTYLVNPNLM